MSNDYWRTPEWLYNYCNTVFGPFDVDLAANEQNTKCKRYIDEAANALASRWVEYGANGFCNPPYSDLPPWLTIARYHQTIHRFPSTWILPTFNGENHWYENVFSKAASRIINICGRVSFLNRYNEPIAGNRQGTQIVHYGFAIPETPKILYVKRDDLIRQYSTRS